MTQITVYTSEDLKEARLCGMGKNTVRLEINGECLYVNQRDYLEALLPDRPKRMFLPVAKTWEGQGFVFLNKFLIK